MNRSVNTATSRSTIDGRTYYKIIRTVTNADGKKHTETVEKVDNEPVKVTPTSSNDRHPLDYHSSSKSYVSSTTKHRRAIGLDFVRWLNHRGASFVRPNRFRPNHRPPHRITKNFFKKPCRYTTIYDESMALNLYESTTIFAN